MDIDHLANRETAIEYLGGCLGAGTLVLVLGAGTSATSGLPDWHTLIAAMCKEVDSKVRVKRSDSADRLQGVADSLRSEHFAKDEPGFVSLVKKCLYSDKPLPSAVLRDPLLIAMGALMTGSRRGSVRRVITLNFDCVLEWYLGLHGLVPRIVHSLPHLEGAEDIRIFHPHGFLPHPGMHLADSGFVVLGLDAIDKRLGTPGEPWMEVTRHAFRTGVCLFIGLSMRSFRDRAIAPLLKTIAPELANRPTGFWLFSRAASDVDRRELLRHNVVPVVLRGRPDYPEFLLQICRASANANSGTVV